MRGKLNREVHLLEEVHPLGTCICLEGASFREVNPLGRSSDGEVHPLGSFTTHLLGRCIC